MENSCLWFIFGNPNFVSLRIDTGNACLGRLCWIGHAMYSLLYVAHILISHTVINNNKCPDYFVPIYIRPRCESIAFCTACVTLFLDAYCNLLSCGFVSYLRRVEIHIIIRRTYQVNNYRICNIHSSVYI